MLGVFLRCYPVFCLNLDLLLIFENHCKWGLRMGDVLLKMEFRFLLKMGIQEAHRSLLLVANRFNGVSFFTQKFYKACFAGKVQSANSNKATLIFYEIF